MKTNVRQCKQKVIKQICKCESRHMNEIKLTKKTSKSDSPTQQHHRCLCQQTNTPAPYLLIGFQEGGEIASIHDFLAGFSGADYEWAEAGAEFRRAAGQIQRVDGRRPAQEMQTALDHFR